MTDTPQLGLPLLQPAQSQKHVTVNEALTRLDALTALTLESCSLATPPATAPEGVVWAVPQGATGAWQGRDGALALSSNGGWAFLTPRIGWRGWIVDEAAAATWDGHGWRAGIVTQSPHSAFGQFVTHEIDVPTPSGSLAMIPSFLPTEGVVFGLSATVVETITGSLSNWSLGRFGNPGQYLPSVGLTVGASGSLLPVGGLTVASLSGFLVSATNGTFSGGRVRLAVHLFRISPSKP